MLVKKSSFLAKALVIIPVFLFSTSCTEPDQEPMPVADDFDRQLMLVNWVDNIIIPSYKNYVSKLGGFRSKALTFSQSPEASGLTELRTAWLDAYIAWQRVSMFEIGKAEAITIRNFTNIFPTDASGIESSIGDGSYNLELPSKNDEQGFPALDYLINGSGEDDAAILNTFANNDAYGKYVNDVLDRMYEMATVVVTDWEGDYKTSFVNNSGSSGTSSVDKVINDYLFYYEKYLRAGKIGIPAGVFSSSPIPGSAEAIYHKGASKKLFLAGLDAVQDFFNGKAFGSSSTDNSLKAYLEYLETQKDGQDLTELINVQFNSARTFAEGLDDDLSTQVTTDNIKMLTTYDQLQKAVVLLKVDMLQALNVQVDFVDADGD